MSSLIILKREAFDSEALRDDVHAEDKRVDTSNVWRPSRSELFIRIARRLIAHRKCMSLFCIASNQISLKCVLVLFTDSANKKIQHGLHLLYRFGPLISAHVSDFSPLLLPYLLSIATVTTFDTAASSYGPFDGLRGERVEERSVVATGSLTSVRIFI